jgi:hypothetical protein
VVRSHFRAIWHRLDAVSYRTIPQFEVHTRITKEASDGVGMRSNRLINHGILSALRTHFVAISHRWPLRAPEVTMRPIACTKVRDFTFSDKPPTCTSRKRLFRSTSNFRGLVTWSKACANGYQHRRDCLRSRLGPQEYIYLSGRSGGRRSTISVILLGHIWENQSFASIGLDIVG